MWTLIVLGETAGVPELVEEESARSMLLNHNVESKRDQS